MPREYNGVVVISQHVLNLFVKSTACQFHSLTGKFPQPFLAASGTGNRASAGNVETEVLGAVLKVTVHIPAPKRCVSFPNNRFKWVCHTSLLLRHVWPIP